MFLNEKIIKSFNMQEYREHRKEIQKFYKELRQKKKKYDKERYIFLKNKVKSKPEIKYKKISLYKKNDTGRECRSYRTKKRLYNDNTFKFVLNLRKRIYRALKGITKIDNTKNLIGCSIEYLKQHLESQFQKGMTWENYGEWHVDHIKPCCKFDFTQEEEQRKCFHYTNLQPLWKIENLRKSGKYNENL